MKDLKSKKLSSECESWRSVKVVEEKWLILVIFMFKSRLEIQNVGVGTRKLRKTVKFC